ncbi:unnamed protein product [Microthlaspi erraticum]|uniref:RNase H type-1 domain-containing protein n=1 Tax=Microthlaspi erraticum TaxID=1685480 RepID=A0A6D2KS12_9BRAS|nr:unnamed protein product [Microthlaspi erraticum]
MRDYTWSTVFAISVWWIWKWRCWNVFGNNGKCRDRVRFLKNLATEISLANEKLRGRQAVGTRVERRIAWKLPENGWWKMNTDGASRGNPGSTATGGVLRDEYGTWVSGFALNIGVFCSTSRAMGSLLWPICGMGETNPTLGH